MSVSQSVIAYYGWLVPMAPDIRLWADKIDGPLPEGVRLIGMDSEHVVFGAKLYESGSSRWGPMEGGNESYTLMNQHQRFVSWFDGGGEQLFKRFSDHTWNDHKLHILMDTF